MKRTIIVAMVAVVAAAAALAADPYPVGSIAFFNTGGCPAGWSQYMKMGGLTVLPDAPEFAGNQTFGGLFSGTQPSHTHSFSASVKLSGVSYAVLSGGGNKSLTSDGTKTATGTTAVATVEIPASGNIPYVQLLACQKDEAPAASQKPPANVLVFTANRSGCSSGWINATRLNRRFIVGLPNGGTAQAAFGGPALAPGANAPSHTHTITPKVTFKPYGVTAAKGGTSGYGKRGEYTVSGSTGAEEVEFPYVSLVACQAQ